MSQDDNSGEESTQLSDYFEDPEQQQKFVDHIKEIGIVAAVLEGNHAVLMGISKAKLEEFLKIAEQTPDGKVVIVIRNAAHEEEEVPELLN